MGFKRVMKNIQKLMGNNELIRHEGGTFGNWTHTLDASEPIAPGRDTVTPGTRVYVVRLVGLCEHFSKNRDRGNWGEGVKGGDGLGPALTSVILSPRLSVSRMCKGLEEEGRGGSGCLQCCKRLPVLGDLRHILGEAQKLGGMWATEHWPKAINCLEKDTECKVPWLMELCLLNARVLDKWLPVSQRCPGGNQGHASSWVGALSLSLNLKCFPGQPG